MMFNKSRKKLVNSIKDVVKSVLRENGYTQTYIPFERHLNEYVVKHSKISYPVCDYGLPIPPVELRSGYETDDKEFIENSRQDIKNLIEIAERSGMKFEQTKTILDFGCSSGRMIRSLKPYADTKEIWGTDVNADHIYWCSQYLKPPFNFAVNTFNPHLPFEDRYFDLIYSGSVFTHIDNLIESWLLELRRILSEDGRLYITIHDNHNMKVFDNDKQIPLSVYLQGNQFYEKSRKDFDFIVLNRSKSPQVFFDIGYFNKLVHPMFEILSVNHESYGYQTGILLKRK